MCPQIGLGTDELGDAGSLRPLPKYGGQRLQGQGRGNDVRTTNDRTVGTEEEAAKPEARDEQYGHLTVEDDPEGTTDEAELLSRHPSQDEA